MTTKKRTRSTNRLATLLSMLLSFTLIFWAIPAQVFAAEPSADQSGGSTASAAPDNTTPARAQNESRPGSLTGGEASHLVLQANSQAVAKYDGAYYSTLQDALDAAGAGGEVQLIAHAEEGELTFPAGRITLNLNGHTLTIPDGQNGFVIRNQEVLSNGLSDITICNGSITGSKTKMWVDTLYARELTLQDLTFHDMTVMNGLNGIDICRSDALMKNCRIENCVGAIENRAGSMISVSSSMLTMNGCTVENCQSGGSTIEAEVDNYLQTSPTLTMNDCRIAYNAGSYCGGLECEGAGKGGSWWATITLNNTVITGNRARNNDYSAGGLNMIRTKLRMNGGAIYGNFVPDDAKPNNSGADVYVYKGWTNMVFPKAADMADGVADLDGHFWIDTIGNTTYEDGISMTYDNLSAAMGLKVDSKPVMVARNIRTNDQYTTLSAAVEQAQAGDTLQLCAAEKGGGHAVTENSTIDISKNLTIDLNGHHLNGLAVSGKVLIIRSGAKLKLIGGRTNDKGNLEANEIDGVVDNLGTLEIEGALTFKDRVLHKGQRLFITGNHGNLRISLAKDKYIEAGEGLTASSVQVFLLDAAELAALNNRNHDHDDVLVGRGGTAALEGVTTTPEIDNPHVRRVHKVGDKGEGLYIVDRIPTGIYLDGVNGDDGNAGVAEDAPVKTFAKAKALLEEMMAIEGDLNTQSTPLAPQDATDGEDASIDGIYVMNTVTVDGTESWSLPKNTSMIRHEGLRGALVRVAGNLTLTDMAIDGHSEGGLTATAPLIDVNDGTLVLGKGSVVRNNVNTTIVSTASHGYAAGGVLARGSSQVLLDGGIVSGNEAGLGGGIGLYNNAMLTMNSGEVSRNSALGGKYHTDDSRAAGGGVFVAGSSKMNFNGGSIANNQSDFFGGGISLGGYSISTISTDKAAKGTLVMAGGEIDGNTAKQNGGGLFVQANTQATISAGSITNNKAFSGLFTGGGIYVNSNANVSYLDYGNLELTNVIITDNQAGHGGGGIGACPTSLTLIFVSSGAAIYDNDAPKAHDVLIDATTGSQVFGTRPEHVAYISHYMLGGGEARWQRDGEDLYTEPETLEELSGHTHMTTHRSLELIAAPTQEDIQKALDIATVRISGNYGGVYGGGLASNGNVRIGTRWNISAHKVWDDADDADGIRPESATVRLKASVVYKGETVEIPNELIPYTTDVTLNEENNWSHTWKDLPEVIPEDDPSVAQYKNLEITYKIAELDVPEGYTYTVNGNMFEGYAITNKHDQEKTSIPVRKVWNDEGHENARPQSITVHLHDGDNVRDLVLDEQNGWSGSFDDLPANRGGKKIEYTLTEDAVEGYTPAIALDAEAGTYTVTNTYTNEEKPTPDKKPTPVGPSIQETDKNESPATTSKPLESPSKANGTSTKKSSLAKTGDPLGAPVAALAALALCSAVLVFTRGARRRSS